MGWAGSRGGGAITIMTQDALFTTVAMWGSGHNGKRSFCRYKT